MQHTVAILLPQLSEAVITRNFVNIKSQGNSCWLGKG